METILKAALMKLLEPAQFGLVHRHHQFAANLVGNGVLPAKSHHLADAGDGEHGLGRAGLVVQAGVQHSAVVASLVPAHGGFLFQDRDARAGQSAPQFAGGCQSDDAATDNNQVFDSQAARLNHECPPPASGMPPSF